MAILTRARAKKPSGTNPRWKKRYRKWNVRLLLRCANQRFTSFADLNAAIRERLERPQSSGDEKLWLLPSPPSLSRWTNRHCSPCPPSPLSLPVWKQAKVNLDYHLEVGQALLLGALLGFCPGARSASKSANAWWRSFMTIAALPCIPVRVPAMVTPPSPSICRPRPLGLQTSVERHLPGLGAAGGSLTPISSVTAIFAAKAHEEQAVSHPQRPAVLSHSLWGSAIRGRL